jgi:hypothetical protein
VTPRCISDRNYANLRTSTTDCSKERRTPYGTKRGPSGPQERTVLPLKNQKNPKVLGSVKFMFSVLEDRPGCTARPSATAVSNI